jgi:hypothetical protein
LGWGLWEDKSLYLQEADPVDIERKKYGREVSIIAGEVKLSDEWTGEVEVKAHSQKRNLFNIPHVAGVYMSMAGTWHTAAL